MNQIGLFAAIILLVAAMVLVADVSPGQQPPQCPELPYYQLVPFNSPCHIHPRTCRTDFGLCRVGAGLLPGSPCQCVAANGVWLPGVIIR